MLNKFTAFLLIASMVLFSGCTDGTESVYSNNQPSSNVLVAYFSYTGNTAVVASAIEEHTGGSSFEIETTDPYPYNYDQCVRRAQQELESDFRPELKSSVPNMESYDIIFLGYPIWCDTIPMPIASFLEEYDFSGKTILPFCTYYDSDMGQSVDHIRSLAPQAAVTSSLAIHSSDAGYARDEIQAWIDELSAKGSGV